MQYTYEKKELETKAEQEKKDAIIVRRERITEIIKQRAEEAKENLRLKKIHIHIKNWDGLKILVLYLLLKCLLWKKIKILWKI